ncbi:hypothetical protein DMH20_18130 [Escherichia coli]|nr:hypothetical protein [Escherichia coli]
MLTTGRRSRPPRITPNTFFHRNILNYKVKEPSRINFDTEVITRFSVYVMLMENIKIRYFYFNTMSYRYIRYCN